MTGPKWEMDDSQGFMVSGEKRIWIGWPCAACGETGANDKATGYCRPCWRAWRFTGSCCDESKHCYNCRCDECCTEAVIDASVEQEPKDSGYTVGMFTGGDGKP